MWARTLALSTGLILATILSPKTAEALQTVPFVDPLKYGGTWYTISRNVLPFENGCVCAQQKLSLRTDGNLDVYNSCNDKTVNGAIREIRGIAFNDDLVTNARFTVDFFLPVKGQYWIIGLADDYQYAVVSDPALRSLYILSKTPTLDKALYDEAVAKAAKQIDTSNLETMNQVGCNYP